MSDYNGSLVNLSIPKEVTQPIVAAKIQEAVLAALGGADKIVESLIHKICNTQVSPTDGKVSSYSSENKISWIDFHVTKIIQDGVEAELKKQLDAGALPIKEALIKVMQSKAGSSKIADAVLQGLTDNFNGKSLVPTIKIEFTKPRDNSRW
jgi:hypothetical protein